MSHTSRNGGVTSGVYVGYQMSIEGIVKLLKINKDSAIEEQRTKVDKRFYYAEYEHQMLRDYTINYLLETSPHLCITHTDRGRYVLGVKVDGVKLTPHLAHGGGVSHVIGAIAMAGTLFSSEMERLDVDLVGVRLYDISNCNNLDRVIIPCDNPEPQVYSW